MSATKSKILSTIICLIPFAVLLALALLFPKCYLLDWMRRSWFLFLWAISAGLVWYKTKWGYVLSFGNFAAVMLGQFLGDYIREVRIAGITPEMDTMNPGEVIQRYEHPGFALWMITLALFISIFIIIQMSRKGEKTD